MATKIEWQSCDYAARDIMSRLIEESPLSLRAFAEQADSDMSFARVRDIRDGRRAPVRLSEFLAICRVCDVDPVETLRQVITLAQEIEEAEAQQSAVDEIVAKLQAGVSPAELGLAASADHGFDIDAIACMSDQEKVQWLADHADDYEAVAKDLDWQAEQEHYEDLP